MLTLAFATRTDATCDPLAECALAINKEFMHLTGKLTPFLLHKSGPDRGHFPGALSNIVDFIRPLQWIPTPMQSRGRRLHDAIVEVYGTMITQLKKRMDSGEDVPDCVIKTLIQIQEKEELDWEDICMLSAVFTLGGVISVRLQLCYLCQNLA